MQKVVKKQTVVKKHVGNHCKGLLKGKRVGPARREQVDMKARVAAVKLEHPETPVGKPWPREQLVWYCMPSPCDWGPLLPDVMKARGWSFAGLPCHAVQSKCSKKYWGEDVCWTVYIKEFAAALAGKSPRQVFGDQLESEDGYELQSRPLPKHALWMMNSSAFRVPNGIQKYREDFAAVVQAYGKNLPEDGRHRMCCFPGMENALKKNNLSTAFRGKPWFPRSYTIPDEKDMLLADIKSSKVQGNYWICKPPNDYGGDGITVFHGSDKALRQVIRESATDGRQVVQNYLADPYLIGGYKFHVRIHMAVTSLDPPQAFVQMNGQCLFATEPYTLSSKSLGKNFKAPVHVTNMCLNATKENKKNYFKKKPIIGTGQQFRVKFLEEYLTQNHPGYDSEVFWKQVVSIAADTVLYMAKARSVKQHGKYAPNRFFEIFGLDLMLNKNLDMFMCEVNTTPGLDYPDELILGEPNPDYDKEAALSGDTLHDLFALLGLDADVKQTNGSLKSWLKVDFENHRE